MRKYIKLKQPNKNFIYNLGDPFKFYLQDFPSPQCFSGGEGRMRGKEYCTYPSFMAVQDSIPPHPNLLLHKKRGGEGNGCTKFEDTFQIHNLL